MKSNSWRLMLIAAMLMLPSALFSATVHVAPGGNDINNDGTVELPFATIQKGVSFADDGDTVKVAGGVYTEAVTSAKKRLTISGSWNSDFTARDLRNGRTVIKAPQTSQDCFTASAVSNTLNGVDLTGGTYGFRGNANGNADKARNHHLISQCVISNNTYGVADGGYTYGIAAISCLFVGNSYGAFGGCDNGSAHYFYNCTFANNTVAIERQHNYGPERNVRNCAFLRNGKAVYANSYSGNLFNLYENAYELNTQDFATSYSWKGQNGIAGIGYVIYRRPPRRGNLNLSADWTPQTGSICLGKGEDLSANSVEPVAEDLYGTAWNGVYDLGCVKSGLVAPVVTKLADVYVSSTGDDAAAGDKEHPMATPEAAACKLADFGTLHLANGTYVGMVSIAASNTTVVGESRDGVILRPTAGDLQDDRPDYALGIFAHNVTVTNLTVTAAAAGILIPDPTLANNTTVENVSLSGNRHGLFNDYFTERRTAYMTTLSHVLVRSNIGHGIYTALRIRVDNALIADNKQDGICMNGWDNDTAAYTYIGAAALVANSTIVGNTSYGYRQVNGTHGKQILLNSILAGNGYGAMLGSKGEVKACCLYNNVGGNIVNNSGTPSVSADCLYTDPLVDETSTLRGHLGEHSPCSQVGLNVNASLPRPVTNDLDYVKRLVDKLDIGCYISPETMNELAGEGYHILNVAGDPNGFGTVTPAYGRHLVADGTISLSAAGTLYTDALDGVRCASVTEGTATLEGVRAAYKGYAYVIDGEEEPTHASDTAETLNGVTFAANATMSWKWERQNLIVVSTDAVGCQVKINDGAPGTCVSNWVAQGTPYTVTFIPTSDFEFDGWGGDFPSSADPRYATTVVTSDTPRHLTPKYRKLIHVAKSGHDDENGNGTIAAPYLTIGKAVSVANKGDVIYVQQGLYEENVVNTTIDQLSFRGGYDANWQRDLRNAQTIVKSTATSKHCFDITGVASNTVSGFVICGGNNGVNMTGPGSPRNGSSSLSATERALCMHVVEQCIISNCNWAIVKGGGWCGVRAYACLVARNKSGGISFGGDNRPYGYIHNCTVVSNTGYGVNFGYGYTSYDMRNCLVADNKGDYGVYHNGGVNDLSLWNNLFLGKKFGMYAGNTVHPMGPAFFEAPKLNADFSLQDDSPAVKAGCNLHAYPYHEELQDVYGTPWNGEYDIGCIKSSASAPAKHADVYVAPDGDDANDGTTAVTPMKTLQLAERRVAEGGTLHLAAGTYDGPLALTAEGMTLQGAGELKTFITGTNITNAVDLRSFMVVHIAALDVTVRDLTVRDAKDTALLLGVNYAATNALVTHCSFKCNKYGVVFRGSKPSDGTACMTPEKNYVRAKHRLTHCRVTDNTVHGIMVTGNGFCGLIADNCLIARNGSDGVNLLEYKAGADYTHDYFYYCTFANNAGIGLTNAAGADSAHPHCINCIFSGNGTGLKRSQYDDIEVSYCVVSGNTVDWHSSSAFVDKRYINDQPVNFLPFTSRKNAFHLGGDSSAIGWGRKLDQKKPGQQEYSGPDDKIPEPTDDLDGVIRRPDLRRDVGCFRRGGRDGAVIILR